MRAPRSQAAADSAAGQSAALKALKLSARETVQHLKSRVSAAFEVFVRRLVTDATADGDLIRASVLVPDGHAMEEFIQDKDNQTMFCGALLTGEAEKACGNAAGVTSWHFPPRCSGHASS